MVLEDRRFGKIEVYTHARNVNKMFMVKTVTKIKEEEVREEINALKQ